MAQRTIENTFRSGMIADALPYLQPKDTYRYARNMTFGDRKHTGYGMAFEESNIKIDGGKGTITGGRYIESLDSTVIFHTDGSIYLFDHTKEKMVFVCKDDEFGCNWNFQDCEWIYPEAKTDQPCNETKIYWSSGCDYYVVNLAEMLNPKRKAALIKAIKDNNTGVCGYTCDHFRLMKCVCAPILTAIPAERGGHKLESGSYQFLVQLEDNGGNKTNWFSATDPVSIGSENNFPGELSHGSIKIHITDIDCRYDKINIAVVKSVEGVRSGRIAHTQHYNSQGITWTYVGQDTGRDISLEELQVKNKMFIRGRKLIQKDSELYLYKIRQEKNLNMQKRVLEEAKLSFIEIETTPEMVKRYGMPTLMRGENYLFAGVYNYCDGTHSKAFLLDPSNSLCSGAAGFSGSITTPTGKAQKVTRPRGGAAGAGEGAAYGCSTGSCSAGGGDTGEQVTPRSTSTPDEGIQNNLEQWTTATPNVVESAKCDDCTEPWCCDDADHPEGKVDCVDCGYGKCVGCEEDEKAWAADLPLIENTFGKHTDEIIDNNQDKPTDFNDYTWKEMSVELTKSINNSEVRKIKADDFTIVTSVGGASSGGGSSAASGDGGVLSSPVRPDNPTTDIATEGSSALWSDQYTDGNGKYLLDEEPKVVGCWAPEVVTTTELYPDSFDCNGEYYYGGLANANLKLFRTPTADKSPFIIPTASGVPSQDSTVDPLGVVKIRLLGIRATMPIPNDEDLPKPLCPNNPWSIVMVQRTEINSTVQAKGIAFGSFEGQSNGETITYLRHGANSRANLDRWIDNGGSRFGSTSPGPGVAFYGLDTAIGGVALSGETYRTELRFNGQGYRYGLYEKGQEPRLDFTGRREDQRGARQYINLNMPVPNLSTNLITAVGYLAANTRNTVSGAKNPTVSTLHRESCVYIEAGGATQHATDSSFTTDTLNHNCPIPDAYGIYAAVVRDIPDQYGAVTGLSFIKTGLDGRGAGVYQGVIGDTYIGPYSFVRKSFVSDKVGNSFGTPERERTVCDSPNDLVLQKLGLDFHSTQLPLSGDRSDAKNWAGGYQDNEWDDAYPNEPDDDYYYPKVQKTLITTWIESRVNPWYRATGLGPGDTGEVYYPKLKELVLDSGYTKTKQPWPKGYINRFSYVVRQPSVQQLLKKYTIKAIVYLALPMLGITQLQDITGVTDATMTAATYSVLIAYWNSIKKLFTRDDYLDKMLGLPVCKTDAAGGEDDNQIEGFEDNYYMYNMDHSALNSLNVYQSMPTTYNTCACDKCEDGETTNEIFYSRKQIEGSSIDYYKQFQAFSYLNIPADKGKLERMIDIGNTLWAHTTDFLIPVKAQSINIGDSIGTVLMGGDRILLDPIAIGDGINEGVAGTTDSNAGEITPLGYVFIDRPAKKVYLFNGSGAPKVISNGIEKLLFEHIDFCDISDCHDHKVETGTYYSIGYDPIFKRVLLTKKDGEDKYSFTLSYSAEADNWVSMHDYKPQWYFWDRRNMYSTKDNYIYKHNANDGTYRNFYSKDYPAEIECVALQDGESFIYTDSVLNTEAEKGGRKNLDKTFNKLAMYNTTQGTGTKNTIVYGDNRDTRIGAPIPSEIISDTCHIKFHKKRRLFHFNNPMDAVKPTCAEEVLTIKEDCVIKEEINEGVFGVMPKIRRSGDSKILVDDHLIYRFTYDQDNDTQLRLLNLKTNEQKEVR